MLLASTRLGASAHRIESNENPFSSHRLEMRKRCTANMQQAACSTQDGTQSATHNMRDMARLHNTYGAMSRQRRNVTGCIMLDWTGRRTACSPSQRTSWLSEMIKLPWLSMNGGMNGCRRGRSVLTPNRDRISVTFGSAQLHPSTPKHTQPRQPVRNRNCSAAILRFRSVPTAIANVVPQRMQYACSTWQVACCICVLHCGVVYVVLVMWCALCRALKVVRRVVYARDNEAV